GLPTTAITNGLETISAAGALTNGLVTTNAALSQLALNNGSALTNLPSDASKVTTNVALDALKVNNANNLTNFPSAVPTNGNSTAMTMNGAWTFNSTISAST